MFIEPYKPKLPYLRLFDSVFGLSISCADTFLLCLAMDEAERGDWWEFDPAAVIALFGWKPRQMRRSVKWLTRYGYIDFEQASGGWFRIRVRSNPRFDR